MIDTTEKINYLEGERERGREGEGERGMACFTSALAAPPCQASVHRHKSSILERSTPSLLLHSPRFRLQELRVAVSTTTPLSKLRLSHGEKALAPLAPKASGRWNWEMDETGDEVIIGSAEFVAEPETSVKFEKELSVPGGAGSMVLLGTGYREKVFAIIGVKVYAAGFYTDPSLKEKLSSWKGKSAAELLENPSLFRSLFQEPVAKSLKIVLVRDVDGNTFWNALDEAISPRIKEPNAEDNSALSTFRKTFEGRPLKKGTVILLTWAKPSKMLVSISSEGLPSAVDAVLESISVTSALFDAFFGDAPVAPTLKASVAGGLEALLK